MFESLLGFLFTEYGILGVSGFVILLWLVKYSSEIKKLIKHIHKNVFSAKEYDSKDILLSKISYWTEFKIHHINIADPGRREIFKDLLLIKFNTIREYIERSSELCDEEMTNQQLYSMVMKCFHESISKYEQLAREAGIPDIVIKKYHEWQAKTFEFTLKSAELICYSNIYGNNEHKIQAIFSLFTAMLELTIAEAEKTLTELNGELTGIMYEGVICG